MDLNVRALIDEALLSEPLLERAQAIWSQCAVDVLARNHGRQPGVLRASDAGRCVRELWAELNDARDLSEDPQGLLKMNTGSLIGAWLACLTAAAAESHGYACVAEVVLGGAPGADVSGHADLSIGVDKDGVFAPLGIVEYKYSAWTGEHGGPKAYQVVQTGKYARLCGAPEFCVVTYYPGTQARFDKSLGTKVAQPHIEPSQWYRTDDPTISAQITSEYARLKNAFSAEMPEGDPGEAFRCRSCRFAACERNINVLNPKKPARQHSIA